VALVDLRRLVGLDPDVTVELDASLDRLPPTPPPLDTLLADARATRPERRALERRIAALAARRVAAESGRRPSVTVRGRFDAARPNPRSLPIEDVWNDSWDVGVSASWPVWEAGRTKADVAEAAAAERAARARLDDFDSQMAVDVQQRRLDLESTRAQLDAVVDAIRSATEARRVIGERFNAGVATSLDVLDAQLALLQTGLDRTRALAAAHLAAARLQRAVGR
jgi:outer membrane protein TolC